MMTITVQIESKTPMSDVEVYDALTNRLEYFNLSAEIGSVAAKLSKSTDAFTAKTVWQWKQDADATVKG